MGQENEIILQSNRIILRRTTLQDLDFVLETEHHEENRLFITPWTEDQHRELLSDRDKRHLIIETVTDRKKAGYVMIGGVTDVNRSIEIIRIVIREKGKGLGKETLRLIKRWAFGELQAHRLWLDVKDFNDRARSLYKKEGFVEEGKLRDCLKAGENFHSLIIMSILAHEYKKL
ncbi:GNAT family N-acetyltransferase [Paenactinomyces guangxiensis]|uniref:GNAT family N-acetyltransferase n=1 Tax=Paenactinomyces guangxiensis TaxID=1490290 RepID=A0A7W1WPM0_9BACL|nr:GNAT family protein [Paenactinomyces guangxiensis]MBA4493603.1 GNAT family N-acetyltransferase [Paenactinomyces guangxiensis]MBH8590890.1 GNAT family N-acetyltransferase [Paenactinomyces guangxiensis]